MPAHHNDHDQENNENHDDCDDCRRQRAQNQKLIAIYQKLQEVDKKSTDVKTSMNLHQENFQKSLNKLKSFDSKVQRIKDCKNSQEQAQFQQIGYQLYAEILQSNQKSQSQKENERLKAILKDMYKQKQSKVQQKRKFIERSLERSLVFPEINQNQSLQWFNQREKTSRVQSRKAESFCQTSIGKSFEISSTKSSFHVTKRKTFEKKDFEQLNLWLFEQKNQVLQKDLYEKSQKSKNPEKTTQLGKGLERYINLARNSTRNQKSPTFTRGTSFSKNNETGNLNETFEKGQGYKARIQQKIDISEENTKSGRFFKTRIKRGSVLPAILNK